MNHLKEIMQLARETKKPVMTSMFDLLAKTETVWTATPKENGAIELTYETHKSN